MEPPRVSKPELSSLRRLLQCDAVRVISRVSSCALFEFELKEWKRSDIEGPAYVVIAKKGGTSAGFLVIANRLSVESYIEELHGEMVVEVSDAYVMYRNAQGKVLGVWILDDQDRSNLVDALRQCISDVSAESGKKRDEGSGNASENGNGSSNAGIAPSDVPPAAPARSVLDMLASQVRLQESARTGGGGRTGEVANYPTASTITDAGSSGQVHGWPIPLHQQQQQQQQHPMMVSRAAVADAIAGLARDEAFVSMVHAALLRSLGSQFQGPPPASFPGQHLPHPAHSAGMHPSQAVHYFPGPSPSPHAIPVPVHRGAGHVVRAPPAPSPGRG